MPVAESFGVSTDLSSATSGRAFPIITFDHWQVLEDDPLADGTRTNALALAVRGRKKLAPAEIPTLDTFLPRLGMPTQPKAKN
jgi:elongation factor 2